MKKDIKALLKGLAKANNIDLMFHTYRKGECSCCYGPDDKENLQAYVNTNIPDNWFGEYYKIVYNEDKIKKKDFYEFATMLRVVIDEMPRYTFTFDFEAEYGDSCILIYINK